MKIVEVINTMITNSDKITNVIKTPTEYFFLYNNKYKWSMSQSDSGDYFLHIYPNSNMPLSDLADITDWQNQQFVTYKSSEIKTREATESFSELFQVVISKAFGIDDIFNDILSDF